MRRTFWLAAGFGLGIYAGERVRRTVVQLTPDTFGERVRASMADAMEAGRVEMRDRERRIREVLAAPERSRNQPLPEQWKKARNGAGTAGSRAEAGR